LEIESLFSSTRWEILKALSQDTMSPMELAEAMHTTSANISQQLRLLELAGLVKSVKLQNYDKGKPRVTYSLNADNAYLILALPGFTEKKMLPLTSYHKFIMRSWFLENQEHHALVNDLYHKVKDHLSAINAIYASSTAAQLTIYIAAKKTEALSKIEIPKVKIVIIDAAEAGKKPGLIKLYGDDR
jgi:predicted transcriptional regulator